jgi:chromosome partitioning protein
MIVALLNQKGGVGKTTLATHIAGELAMRGQHRHPAGCRPAGFIAGLDAAQKPARLAKAVQRRGPGTRNPASGSARTRQAGRSRRHRWAAQDRRLGALRAAGGRARADPRAAQSLRPVGQRRDGGADPRGAGVPAALRAAFVINRRVSTTVIGREARGRWPSSRFLRCARKCASASCSPTAWPLAGSHARRRRTAPPRAKSPRWWMNCCGGRHDSEARHPTANALASASASARVRPRIRTPRRGFAKASADASRKATSTPLA